MKIKYKYVLISQNCEIDVFQRLKTFQKGVIFLDQLKN